MDYIKLNNGQSMPMLGFGIYQIKDLKECEECILEAIKIGYRLFDTAQIYGNEEALGNALSKTDIPGEDLFITTKVWVTNVGYEKTKSSIKESLNKLQTDYLDLVLIHQPYNGYYGTYRALEELYKEGKVKAIGLSNFQSDRLIDLIGFNEILPVLNQIETHVFNQQIDAHKYMDKYKVHHQS